MPYKMDESDDAALAARTVRAFGDRNLALNDLRDAKMTESELRRKNLETRAEAEQAAAAHDLEVGNWESHAQHQRNMAELAVAQAHAEDERRYWEARPTYAADPVAALLEAKRSEPETISWLKKNPLDAAVLATNSDPARVAQIQSSHAAAVAAGHPAGSAQYYGFIDKHLGMRSAARSSGNEGGKRVVRVVKHGQAAGENEMTEGERVAATETLTWGHNAPPGKRGTPIGIEEYLRRRNLMRGQPGWFDKLQD
jgi:hypothetical protein